MCLSEIQKANTDLNMSLSVLRTHFNGCIAKQLHYIPEKHRMGSFSNPAMTLKTCRVSLYVLV